MFLVNNLKIEATVVLCLARRIAKHNRNTPFLVRQADARHPGHPFAVGIEGSVSDK
jgi:hypothetical protein